MIKNPQSVLPGDEKKPTQARVVRKSYALTKQDIQNIQTIKDKCLDKKIVLSDSQAVRLALYLATHLSEATLVKGSTQVPKLLAGRPRKK